MEITAFTFLCFYTVVLLLYYAAALPYRKSGAGGSIQWCVLLAASLAFYLLSGTPVLVLFPLGAGLITAFIAGRIGRTDSDGEKKKLLVLNLVLLIGALVLLKYLNFGGGIAMPLGLSFYTFTLAGYVIDVYLGIDTAQKNPAKVLLYGMYFPLMVSGPILTHREHAEQFYGTHLPDYRNLTRGAQRTLWGFFQKLVIAERCAVAARVIFDHYAAFSGAYIALGALLFTFQLYTDFSGCMDIVLGLSEMLGLVLPENFKTPFFSKSISEYWRRWHITLGVWMRGYVFYPLLRTRMIGNLQKKLRARFGKKAGKDLSTYAAMFILWLTVGLWHGGALKYVIGAGLLHWFYIVTGLVTLPFWKKVLPLMHIPMEGRFADGVRIVRTFVLVNIGNVFFRAQSAAAGAAMLVSALGKTGADAALAGTLSGGGEFLRLDIVEWLILGVSLLALLAVSVLTQRGSVRDMAERLPLIPRWALWLALLFYVILFGNYGPGYSASAFIYQGF